MPIGAVILKGGCDLGLIKYNLYILEGRRIWGGEQVESVDPI